MASRKVPTLDTVPQTCCSVQAGIANGGSEHSPRCNAARAFLDTHPKSLLVLLVAVFVDLLAVALVIPLLPQYASKAGMDPALFGLLGSAYGVAQLLGSPVMGGLSDGGRRVLVLLSSCAGTMIAYLLMDHATSIAVLFASRLVVGFVKQTSTAAQAYICDVTSRVSRNKMIGRVQLAVSVAFIVGPFIGGELSRHSAHLPATVAACLLATEFALLWALLPEPSSHKSFAALRAHTRSLEIGAGVSPLSIDSAKGAPPRSSCNAKAVAAVRSQTAAFGHLFAQAGLAHLLLTIFLFSVGLHMHESVVMLSLQRTFQLSSVENGRVLSYLSVLSAAVQGLALPWLTARFSDYQLIPKCLFGVFVAHGLAGSATSLWVWLAVNPLLAVSSGVAKTVLTGALTKAVNSDEVGSALGVIGSFSSICRVIAPLVSGALVQAYGARAVDAFIAALGLALFIFVQFGPAGTQLTAATQRPEHAKPKKA